MEGKSPKELVPLFFGNTANTYDSVVMWATFGRDRYWKNEILTKIENPSSILDLACGTGILTRKLARMFPKSKILGIDISKNYLSLAEKNSLSFSNVSFLLCDAENLDFDKKFDCICSSYIPKYCDPKVLVKNMVSHLNAGGKIVLHDFTYPKNQSIRMLWRCYFVLLNLMGYFTSWKYAFKELPILVKNSDWTNSYKYELEKYGFAVTLQSLTLDSSTILAAQHQP